MAIRNVIGVGLVAALSLLAASCDGSANSSSTPTAVATPPSERPLPPPVEVSPEPQGITLADPEFQALPGATADHGRLGGSVYQIEMPDNWNGRLLLYMHGFQGLAPEASVQMPGIRRYLIENGWAWGASSYSSTSLIPGRAADETAALWDYFVKTYGRPERTYVTGHSMGGAATHIAAERYGDRFDGALAMCGFAGQAAQTAIVDDYFFVGAYVAGITQAEFDASTDYPRMIRDRILPALEDPEKRDTFERILIDLTGGPRAFDRLGMRLQDQVNWDRAGILIATRVEDTINREYLLRPDNPVSNEEFNAGVIRMRADETRRAAFLAGNEITGDLQMPMITLHTTGDWQVPIDQQQILRRYADDADKSGLLVQRVVRAPEHCGFADREWETSLEDLVAWVEDGMKPEGEDVLVDDLTTVGDEFTMIPRFGSDEAADVSGAEDRVTLSGTITLDGNSAPNGMFAWPEVWSADGLPSACGFPAEPVRNGRYEFTVAAATELAGCGAEGSTVRLVMFHENDRIFSNELAWTGDDLQLDAAFSTDAETDEALTFTWISGSARDGEGERLPPGTLIEAYIDGTLCARTAIPPVAMNFGDPDYFIAHVASPDAVPGCDEGGEIRFEVNGEPVETTAAHTLDFSQPLLDLVLD